MSVKIIANIANKTPKAAPRLGFDVGVFTQKNSQQSNNPSDKSDSENKCKRFFYIFLFLVYKDICNTIICSLTAQFLSKGVKNDDIWRIHGLF